MIQARRRRLDAFEIPIAKLSSSAMEATEATLLGNTSGCQHLASRSLHGAIVLYPHRGNLQL